ncbi:hypothetical protein Nos7524_0008 [Nostoc sp. PCC 7524]|uniref:hypothetical protein n=1 Tax=Nostoc sp. (strain ATCC 29411 / PCC 7524) TaxID=28072 RepID=UPI00029F2BC8|nr:hypothetical protein [Nostoc sp. PCC 7524]AFY45937.1 hypothetical protein Nos7524_0008 [Nostoc sp. PCC 7524]
MPLKLKHITNTSILVLVSVGSAIATTELLMPQQPALAQKSVGQCIQNLRNRGVSGREAARICRNRRGGYWDDYRGRGQYIELQARSGPTLEGRWRYSAPGVPYNAMTRAGCQQISGDDWRCPTPRIRVQTQDGWGQYPGQNERGRFIELQARSGPTLEGRWRYSAPGVPYDAMIRAGCQQISGDDWRCPTPRIRVQVTQRY